MKKSDRVMFVGYKNRKAKVLSGVILDIKDSLPSTAVIGLDSSSRLFTGQTVVEVDLKGLMKA